MVHAVKPNVDLHPSERERDREREEGIEKIASLRVKRQVECVSEKT